MDTMYIYFHKSLDRKIENCTNDLQISHNSENTRLYLVGVIALTFCCCCYLKNYNRLIVGVQRHFQRYRFISWQSV